MDTGLILPEKAASIADILLGTQNLPVSGKEGGEHARKIQKLLLEPPASSAGSSGGTAAKKKK
jgi:hypothetical protein